MEQAGTVGKRRTVPVHDRSPLDPVFGSGPRIATLKCAIFGLNSRQGMRALVAILIQIAVCAVRAETPYSEQYL
jgi:hypothetical protein